MKHMMAFLKLMGVDEDMTDTVWTEFWDMHSGRTRKIEWDRVYIEAPVALAKRVFQDRYKRNPDNVSCECCGSDFDVFELTLSELPEAIRFGKSKSIQIITASNITIA